MRSTGIITSFTPFLILAACGGGASGGGGGGAVASSAPPGTDDTMSSPMELRLTDAPNDQVSAVVVSLKRIDVHVEDVGWFSVMNKMQTLDLLHFQNGAYQTLGASQLPAGHVIEFRIYTENTGPNYVVTADGQHHELKMPTGIDCGIKVKVDLRISGCAKGYVTFDYDAKQSISTTTTTSSSYSGTQNRLVEQWVLTPVIRLKAVVALGTCADLPPPAVTCGGDGGITLPPTSNPPSTINPPPTSAPPPTSTPPATTTPPSEPPPTLPPPVSTTTPPGTMPPVIIAPPPPSDPCEKISCGGASCVNGTCTVIIN